MTRGSTDSGPFAWVMNEIRKPAAPSGTRAWPDEVVDVDLTGQFYRLLQA
jgi:hypothetical protein